MTALGRPVRALARPESAHLVSADGVEVAEGDLGDPDSLRAAVSGGVSAVVHAACTFTDPATDVAAMRALLDGWTRGPFVFVSSVDAYGRPPGPEVGEGEAAVRPVSAYGQGKLDCERLLLAAAGTRGRGGASAVRAPSCGGRTPGSATSSAGAPPASCSAPSAPGNRSTCPATAGTGRPGSTRPPWPGFWSAASTTPRTAW
ncbi:NAD-dependent epimerase/dehydratase family protein [Streptomyces stramineus]